jgi:hypothetical protein
MDPNRWIGQPLVTFRNILNNVPLLRIEQIFYENRKYARTPTRVTCHPCLPLLANPCAPAYATGTQPHHIPCYDWILALASTTFGHDWTRSTPTPTLRGAQTPRHGGSRRRQPTFEVSHFCVKIHG